MNPFYKQPVIILGVVVPLLVLFVLLGVVSHYRSGFEATYKTRTEQHVQYKKVQKQREALEKKVKEQDPYLTRWMALFDNPTSTNVNSLLGEVQKRYKGDEFQQTSFRPSMSPGGIGGASGQPAMQLQLTFRGTYRGLQNAFLELETQMPHLQLDSLKLKQESNRNVLSADVTYTAWQKE